MTTQPVIREVRVADLVVDHQVQRSLDLNRAKRMATSYDPSAVGAITVSERADGSLHVVDGQHRSQAARFAHGKDATVTALVYTGLSLAEEALLFRKLNTTKQVHPLQRFKVRLVEEDPAAIILNDILTHHGWRVGPGGGEGAFAAVAALEKVFFGAGVKRKGVYSGAVKTTIGVVTDAWGHGSDAVRQEIVTGLGAVFVKHPGADAKKITRELAALGSPLTLLSKAKARNAGSRSTLGGAVASIAVELHNKGRRKNRLPRWDAS